MATIKIKLRASTVPGKAGTVYYQVIHRKEVKQITTQIHLLPHEWNAEEGRISSAALSCNPRLSPVQRKMEEDVNLLRRVIRDLELTGSDFGVQSIIERFSTFQTNIYVLEQIDKEIETLTTKGKHSTAKNYRCCRNSLAEFLQGRDIPFDELTETLVAEYESWLRDKGMKRNASSSYLRTLQSMHHKLVKQGKIPPPNRSAAFIPGWIKPANGR